MPNENPSEPLEAKKKRYRRKTKNNTNHPESSEPNFAEKEGVSKSSKPKKTFKNKLNPSEIGGASSLNYQDNPGQNHRDKSSQNMPNSEVGKRPRKPFKPRNSQNQIEIGGAQSLNYQENFTENSQERGGKNSRFKKPKSNLNPNAPSFNFQDQNQVFYQENSGQNIHTGKNSRPRNCEEAQRNGPKKPSKTRFHSEQSDLQEQPTENKQRTKKNTRHKNSKNYYYQPSTFEEIPSLMDINLPTKLNKVLYKSYWF